MSELTKRTLQRLNDLGQQVARLLEIVVGDESGRRPALYHVDIPCPNCESCKTAVFSRWDDATKRDVVSRVHCVVCGEARPLEVTQS